MCVSFQLVSLVELMSRRKVSFEVSHTVASVVGVGNWGRVRVRDIWGVGADAGALS